MISRSDTDDFSDDEQDSFESPSNRTPCQVASQKRSGLSLKARAVSYLSRREHSRVELTRKLAPHADSPEELEALLDSLAREGWQSDRRFVQGVVHTKSPAQGSVRIIHALRQQGISDAEVALVREQLKETELARACEVWQKRFGAQESFVQPLSPAEYAKQARFLAARGFTHDVIRRVLKRSPFEEDI
jgi:regulatory protein